MGHSPVLLDMTDLQFAFPRLLPDDCYTRHAQLIVKTVLLVLCAVLLLPLMLLIYVQLTNFSSNQTTNERFSKRPAPPSSPPRKLSVDYDDEA